MGDLGDCLGRASIPLWRNRARRDAERIAELEAEVERVQANYDKMRSTGKDLLRQRQIVEAENAKLHARLSETTDMIGRLLDEEAVPDSARPEVAVQFAYNREVLSETDPT